MSFPSDAESPLTYTPIPSIDETITETGDFRTIYDRPDATGENPNFTIRYPSDVEPTGNVPEPASLALGLAFAGRISLATAQAALTRSDKQDKKTKTKPES